MKLLNLLCILVYVLCYDGDDKTFLFEANTL